MTNSLISVDAISVELSLTPQQVRNLCRNGKIPAQKIGNTWVIDESDFYDYKSNNYTKVIAEDRVRYNSSIPKKPISLSFFSGAMGLDLGLELAGFETLLACEVDQICRQTIVANRPEIALLGDIRDYSAFEIMEASGLQLGNDDVDLIIGGPPCQAFSTAGKRRGFNDNRGNVFLRFIDLALEISPKYFVLENVRGLLSAPLEHRPHNQRGEKFLPLSPNEMPGGALLHIIEKIRSSGYSVTFNLYNAANFGTPQSRERVVIICARDGRKVPYLTPTHSDNDSYGLPPWRTFRNAVHNLYNSPQDYVQFPKKRLRYYKLLGPGENWRNLPEDLQKEAMGKSYYSGGGKTGFLRRLAWDKPSPTLVTYPAMPATDLAHPEENRPLSIQEYKRLQEFPDSWILCGSLRDQYKQVGNAVPTSLGKAIGHTVKAHMKQETPIEYSNFRYSRYLATDDVSWENKMREVLSKEEKTALGRQMRLPLDN
ncbi:MAG: DNA cytosine methyltransferase [Anaerolineae bacterium]|nr:DNA cytosine methyltransferase [Anaerolineae bacterium]